MDEKSGHGTNQEANSSPEAIIIAPDWFCGPWSGLLGSARVEVKNPESANDKAKA